MDFWDDLNSTIKAMVGFMIVLFIATALYLAYYRTFAVPFENTRRDAYEHSRSYVEGAARDIGNLCVEAEKADATHRDLLQDTIRERYVKLDEKDVPDYLRQCLRTAREGAK